MEPILHHATKRRLEAIRSNPKGSYLFYGPGGVGRRTAAMWLAERLNCLGDEPGLCRHCRQLAAGNFSDLIVVSLDEDATSIKIERLRLLQHALCLKPYTSGWRVVIIRPAEALGHEAQNSLLKLIEEPPDRTMIIIVAESPESLLPTIQSRVHATYIAPVTDEDVRLSVAGANLPESEIDAIVTASCGRVGIAKTLARQPLARNDLQETSNQAKVWLEGSTLHRLAEAGKLSAKPEKIRIFIDQLAVIARRNQKTGTGEYGATLAGLERCRRRLIANGNPRASLEVLALEADNA